jgi:hypothetical protein
VKSPEQLLRDHGVEIALDDHRTPLQIAIFMAELGIINSHLVLLAEHAQVNHDHRSTDNNPDCQYFT